MRYFSTWSSRPYRFESEEIRERHARIVSTPRKALVLTELRDIAAEFYDVNQLDCIPRSKYSPEMLIEPCRKFEQGGKMPAIHWTEYRKAVKSVRNKLVRKQKVTPIKLRDVPFDPTKNSGLPFLATKRDVYEVTLERAQACEEGQCPPPMTMFSRGKNLDVARPVLAGPFEWQLVEGKFFYPLQKLLLSFDNPYLAGVHSCTVGAKVDYISNAPYVLCMDYSGFDGSLSGLLINSGFSILRGMLDLGPELDRQWKAVVAYFITSPILCPDQRVYYGRRHGVPSGSMFTQMIDTVCNMIIIEYVALRLNAEIGHYYVVGDDSIVQLFTDVTLTQIVDAASELGIRVNPTKSELLYAPTGADIHFLGHTYANGLPERAVSESFQRLLTPERPDKRIWSKSAEERYEYYIERVRAYQEDNANLQAWELLRLVETRLNYPNSDWNIIDLQRRKSQDRHYFRRAAVVERERWDHNRRELRYLFDGGGRYSRPAVFWA